MSSGPRWRRVAPPSASQTSGGSSIATEQDRPDILKQRWACFEGQAYLDPGRLVFINETCESTIMVRGQGQAPKGQRLPPGFRTVTGRRRRSSPAPGNSGMVAPIVLDGPINRDAFPAYVEQVLVLELRPSHIVISDEVARHTALAVRVASRPPARPFASSRAFCRDFNLIDKAFLKPKAHLCKASGAHRSRPLQHHRLHPNPQPTQECANSFSTCGYEPT